MGKRRIKLGKRVAKALDLPEETLTGELKVTIYGENSVIIENHRGIFECTDSRISLRMDGGIITVSGDNLTIMELGTERVYINGLIISVKYEK